jgi:phosphoenolpyruvate carboxykinase (GTP)
MMRNKAVSTWVDEMARLCKPDKVEWCDGSEEERGRLTRLAVADGTLIELDPKKLPGCYLHRSNPNDVARTEQLTFICSTRKEDAGVTNNWMDPKEAYAKLGRIFDGSMKGRTMYVVPYLMGPAGSPFSKAGVELTDSVYVVLNMRIMTRMGEAALQHQGSSSEFVKGLHSVADCNPERRFICHFPQDRTIWSVGSGYGGNALLGKKCFALRIGSTLARREGWLAEHMLIVGITPPDGEERFVCAAFPSACGKTNLAMLEPPPSYRGWKVRTIGDDIAWLRFGEDGRLWAINPESGFFGVAPGTSDKTNPNAMKTVNRNSLFTNVVLTADRTVWWEGMEPPAGTGHFDWQGRPWTPGKEKGAHPNARYTAPAAQCPIIHPRWEDPRGVPISAILFGGRRAKLAPLVYQAFNWRHGVYVGSTMASETTAAATGQVGVVRRDPMAMLPFCGYDIGDYFAHWLSLGRGREEKMPRIFHVNWFRTDDEGRFLWPGYGENIRVLRWVLERCRGKGAAVETPIGWVPSPSGIDLSGLSVSEKQRDQLLRVDAEAWHAEAEHAADFYRRVGPTLPEELQEERRALLARLRHLHKPDPASKK